MPTFDPPAPQEVMEVLEDEEPEAVNMSQGSDFHFFFLVDRSGSMSSFGRMQSAIDALKLFIRSLPTGCKFSIKSFGSRFTDLIVSNKHVIPYNEATKKNTLSQLDTFRADHGGTNIVTPLVTAQAFDSGNLKKRIFILTDGEVKDRQ